MITIQSSGVQGLFDHSVFIYIYIYIYICVISGFRHEVDEFYSLLGYYAASSGNSLPTFRDNLQVPSSRVNKLDNFLALRDGTDRLFRNVGKEVPLYAA